MRTAGRINERPNRHRRSRRRAEPSKIEVVQQPSTADAGEVDANSPTKDVLAPHAKFFIEREKSVVSIKFDPPVYVDPTNPFLINLRLKFHVIIITNEKPSDPANSSF